MSAFSLRIAQLLDEAEREELADIGIWLDTGLVQCRYALDKVYSYYRKIGETTETVDDLLAEVQRIHDVCKLDLNKKLEEYQNVGR